MENVAGSAEHELKCGKLCVLSFGFALAIVWALGVLIMGITASWFGYGKWFVESVGYVYVGYKASFIGVIVGIIWALVDAFIAGIIFAWLYNCFMKACHKKCSHCSTV